MFFLTIVGDYLWWHYTTALISFIRIFKNFWWFIVNFFSIPQLISSLLSPYKRITEKRGDWLDLESWAGYILINLVSRLIGLSVRLVIILLGIFTLTLYIALAVFSYGIWLIAPILTMVSFVLGFYLII